MTTDNIQSDLAKERLNATFDVEDLTNFIYGGREKVKRKRYVQNIATKDPYYKTLKPWNHCSVEEQYENSIAKHIHTEETFKKFDITDPEELQIYRECSYPNESGPFGVNNAMFIPSLVSQGTEEQQRKWLPLAKSTRMIGTYAQTELGHGTFLRGLETTATYNPTTKEFIIDSPTLTSTKFWPAALGKTANHCVVMAQLYTQGKCHGVHMFLVQLRSMEDHSVMPGIECGVIGNKFGFGTNDNGFLRLDKVRIPRENMLMKYSEVLEDGTYRQSGNKKLTYGVMVYVRAMIVSLSYKHLSEACTIAIRYSAVRRQSEQTPGGVEPQILDYQTQQYRLFPLLSTAYAFLLTGKYMLNTYKNINEQIKGGNLDQLPQLHALSSGLKAFTTYASSAGVEVCRICCGGHGYLLASGFPKIYVAAVPGCTYEGENTVMMLQTARYLMKCYNNVQRGQKLPGFVQYIGQKRERRSRMTAQISFESIVEAYTHRANRLVESAAKKMQSLIQSGKPAHVAWNLSSVQLFWAANAHCHLFCVKNFVDSIQTSAVDKRTMTMLRALCQLYGVHGIVENVGDFMHDGFLSGEQVDYLQNRMLDLFAEIRPNAVSLVDAFDYPDQVLESCLGRYDGQVYQALYDSAKSSPMNQTEIHSSYNKYIKPMMNSMAAEAAQNSRL